MKTSETMSFMDGPLALRTRLVWRSKEEQQLICVCKLGHSYLNECFEIQMICITIAAESK